MKAPKLLTFAIASTLLFSCAPKLEKREYSVARMDFTPSTDDTELDFKVSKQAQAMSSKLVWKGEVSTAQFFNASEIMIRLGRKYNRQRLELQGERLAQSFYKASGTTTRPSFLDTLLVDTAINLNIGELEKEIAKNRRMIDDGIATLLRTLEESKRKYPWPQKGEHRKVDQIKAVVKDYVNFVVASLAYNGMDPKLQTVVSELVWGTPEAPGLVTKEMNTFFPLIDDVRDEKRLRPLIVKTMRLLDELGVTKTLSQDEKAQIAEADRLGAMNEQIRDAQDVAAVLVDLWRSNILFKTQQEKIEVFNSIEAGIADDLAELSNKELNCLADRDCDALINTDLKEMKIAIGKKMKVFPKINAITHPDAVGLVGVPAVKFLINKGAADLLIKTLEIKATELISQLPRIALDKVRPHLDKPYEEIRKVERDKKGFIRNIVAKFSDKLLQGEYVPGVESSRINLTWLGGKMPKVSAVKSKGGLPSGAETLGASFALANLRLEKQSSAKESNTPQVIRNSLSQINKLLAISGFEQSKGKMFKAFTVSQRPNTTSFTHFDLAKNLDSKVLFAIPDRFNVTGNYNGVQMTKGRSISVAGQAEVLRGLSGMIRYFKDWDKNGFDHSLGKISVADLLGGEMGGDAPADPNDPTHPANIKPFDKSTMFTLAVGNAANILLNFERELTMIYMTEPKGSKVIWLNEFKQDATTDTIISAGVNIVDGQRQLTTKPADVARLLLAVIDFVEATDGLERTNSKELLCLDKNGKAKMETLKNGRQVPACKQGERPLDKLLEARGKLEGFVMTSANFLSSMMIREDNNLAYASFNRETGEKIGASSAVEQALIVRALLSAARVKQLKAYVNSAVNIYVGMNKLMFNPETGFYNSTIDSKKLPNPHEILAIIESLDDLNGTIQDPTSQANLEKIISPWLGAFEAMK